MTPTEPQDEREDDGGSTPTIVSGSPFEELSQAFDADDLRNIREFLQNVDAEARKRDPETPTTLDALGPFRDLVEIGRGGMGVVYRARDPESGEVVAVKVPAPGLMFVPSALKRFDNEAEAGARLDHPAVVPHRWLGESGGRSFIVSDFCDGPDLEAWLRERKDPVPPRQSARIVRDLAGGLAHAHDRGVLHRDVKPSNILLPGSTRTSGAETLTPRLTDFGLAKLLDGDASRRHSATVTGQVMGCPPYMAPEQVAGRKDVDHRADVYGLGAVLYELLTVRPPFRGETTAETLGMIMVDEPIPVRVLRPGVPKPLEAIVLKCLEKDPGRRYQTADALREDLDAFLAGRRVRAPRPGPIKAVRGWARRNPRSAVLAAAALVLGLASAAGVTSWTVALSRGRDRADQYVYDSRIQLALRAFEDGHLVRVQPILHGLLPRAGGRDRREFAWHYLWDRCRREARMLVGSRVEFDHLAVSPDGRFLAGGGANGIQVYDLAREAPVWHTPTPGRFLCSSPVFSPDGRSVAFQTYEDAAGQPERLRSVEVCRTVDGALVGRRSSTEMGHILAMGFAGEGRLVVVDDALSSESPDPGRVFTWADRGAMPDVAPEFTLSLFGRCTPDGLKAAGVDISGRTGIYDSTSRVWTPLEDGPTAEFGPFRFSDDGRRLAIAHGRQGEVLVYDVADGKLRRRFPAIGAPVSELAVRPDGEAVVVVAETREVRLLVPTRGLDLRIFPATSEPGVATNRTRFAPDGHAFFVHRSEYLKADHIEVRSAEDGRRLGETPGRYKAHTGPLSIRPGPTPELIYALGRHAWRWDWSRSVAPEPEDALKAHNDEIWTVAYSTDGSLLATSSNHDRERATIRLRTADGVLVREWLDGDSTAADLALAPDASWIATAHMSPERALRIRPVRGDGEVVAVEFPGGEWARCVRAAPDRPLVYAGGGLGTVLAWDVSRREAAWRVEPSPVRLLSKSKERIHDLAVSPDGLRLAVANDRGEVLCLDARTGTLLASHAGPAPMLAVAYAPDGQVIAAADQEGRIHLLSASDAEPLQVISGDDCDLRSLAFSPDGRTLAAAGLSRIVRLWDPSTGEELLALPGHEAQINSLAFSPDGQTLASGDHSGVVRFWRAPRPSPP